MLSPAGAAALSAAPGALLPALFSTLAFEEASLAGSWDDLVFVALIPGSFSSSSDRQCLPFLLLADLGSPLPAAPLSLLFPAKEGREPEPVRGQGGAAVLAAQASAPPPELYLPNYKLRAALKGSPKLY